MKKFLVGFVKVLLGFVLVLLIGLLFCYFTGLLDAVGLRIEGKTEESPVADPEQTEGAEEPEEQEPAAQKPTEQKPAENIEAEPVAAAAEEAPEEEPPLEIRILFAGDLLLTEALQRKYKQNGIDAACSEDLLARTRDADIFMLNQEFPFGTTGEPMADKQFTFRINPSFVTMEQDMGVDIVTLANNHTLDFGRSPLTETLETLDQAGIAHVGAGETPEAAYARHEFEVQGKKIGFLGATRVIPVSTWAVSQSASGLFSTYDPAILVGEIKKAAEVCDFVIVYVHWGIERNTEPESYQRDMARLYIDAGADAVIGSHPHVLQGVEFYQGKPILYSLGNFIFSNRDYETMMAELVLTEEGCGLWLLPCSSNQNRMSLKEDGAGFYQRMRGLSPTVQISDSGEVRE